MRDRVLRSLALAAGLVLFAAVAVAEATQTRSVLLRVEGQSGTLETGRGYVAGTVSTLLARSGNPNCRNRKGSQRFAGPTPIGALGLAGHHNDRLRPLRMRHTDFGWQLCQVGGGKGFGTEAGDFGGWLYRTNHEPGFAAMDEMTLRPGDDLLVHYAVFPGPGSTTEPLNNGRELVLRGVPARVRPGEPFQVRVLAYDFDPRNPADGRGTDGIRIRGGGGAIPPDVDGRATLTIDEPGTTRLFAVDTQQSLDPWGNPQLDISSERLEVCVRARLSACPAARGKLIRGSGRDDRIRATRGDDVIRAGGGDDVVDLRPGGRNRVNCGSGSDRVLVNRGERGKNTLRNCQRVLVR